MMDPISKNLGPENKANNKPISLPNGTLKKPHHSRSPPPTPPPPLADYLYRECLKNHAASLGGHALDGCGEFISSPSSNPSDPTSLKCAACGCHRNFHRRLPDTGHRHNHHHHHVAHPTDEIDDDRDRDDDDEDVEEDGEAEEKDDIRRGHLAPHVLLSLSAGGRSPITPTRKRRFRTKFSREQKEGMMELAERVGWRLQRRDEGVVEEGCRRIGVERVVFKVWMHNNKQAIVGSRRREMGSSGGGGGGGENGSNNNNDNNNHVANCSSPST